MVDMCRRSRCVKLFSFRIWDFDWSFFWEGSTTSKGCRKLEAVQTCDHKLLRNAFPASIEEEAEGLLVPIPQVPIEADWRKDPHLEVQGT